ncbi:ABC transporter permease [Maribacter algicola]|uniref:ABC transporter permease n=1 Tax=Meishania litoralis TaxID=3434685 RepID=A0ACC7LK57_9FLAO
MFKNYIKIAWRSLKKQPFFTSLNIFGLAIGIAGGLLISLYIYDELSYDTMFADADRIYRVNADIKFGGPARDFAVQSAPMAATLKNDYPEVELATRFRTTGSMLIKESGTETNVKEEQTTYVDATFFEMFGVSLLIGDTATALKEPNTLILTKTAAEKHFNVNEALGQHLVLNNGDTYTVTGVIEDLPRNSFLRDHSVFMAMEGYEDSRNTEWGSHNYQTYVKLIPGADAKGFETSLKNILKDYVMPWAQQIYPGVSLEQFEQSGNYIRYSIIGLTDIHLHSDRVAEISPNNRIENIYILSFIAVFLIVLASVNFMNLSTAHSLKRAKEVGIRKTLGSGRAALVRQFLIESTLIVLFSLIMALILSALALPLFNSLSGKEISLPLLNPVFWLVLLAATAILALLSGSYPSLFMSRFIPVKVLKGSGENSLGGSKIRNALVIFQFAISVFLIVATLVVYQQLRFIQNKELGFNKDQVLVVNDVFAIGQRANSLKDQVQGLGFVESATLSSYLPTPSSRSDSSFFKEGSTEQENAINMQAWGVDHEYMSTLGLKIVAGRNFDRQFGTDSLGIIVNESALNILGLQPEEALGLRLSRDLGQENPEFYKVIGVVENFHFDSMRSDIGALSLTLADNGGSMAVKLKAGDFSNVVAQVEAVWNKVAPDQPFNYYFMDESFNTTYEAEQRLGRIFMIFSILSIIIACLGLFGLAAFNAEKRTKEIGVRKVLGASVGQVAYQLTVDFLKLVGIGILISLPIGWFAMNKWLEDFSYRIEIGAWVFVLAALLAIAVSIITVSYQSIKAAIVNPVKSLRTE